MESSSESTTPKATGGGTSPLTPDPAFTSGILKQENNNHNKADGTTEATSGNETTKPENWHRRKISWGVDTLLGEKEVKNVPPSPGIAGTNSRPGLGASPRPEPVLEEDDENARQAAYIQNLFAGAPPRRSFHHNHVSSLGNIDLSDILKESPMEQEAESYILKAIEERAANYGETKDPASVFPEIPDDAVSALSTNQDTESDAGGSLHTPVPHPPKRSNSSNSKDNSPVPPTPSNNTAGSSAGGSRRRRSSMMVKQPSTRKLVDPGWHRRKPTMEQQLFGLTSALEGVYGEHDSEEMLPSFVEEEEEIPPATSAEALEQNATRLYKRANGGGGGGGGGGGSTAGSAGPGSLRDHKDDVSESNYSSKSYRNLMNYKKTDGDSNDSVHATPETTDETGPSVNGEITADAPSVKLNDIEEGIESDENNEPPKESVRNKKGGKLRKSTTASNNKKKKKKNLSGFREFQDFFSPRKTTFALYFRVMFVYLAAPLLGIAAILFYLVDNPPTGRLQNGGHPFPDGKLLNEAGERVDPDKASISWILIFVARQIVTFTLAKLSEIILIDFMTIRGMMDILGPLLSLLVLQSKGWPSTISLWSIFNFILLSGPYEFPRHWMYWQDYISVFSLENPGGSIVNSGWNYRILTIALILGVVVAIKRLLLGLYLGRRTFESYADQLAKIMQNILMISEVSALGKDFERELRARANRKGVSGDAHLAQMTAQREKLVDIFDDMDDEGNSVGPNASGLSVGDKSSGQKVDYVIDPEDRNPWSGLLSYTQQQRIIQLLGAWEEPVVAEKRVEEKISVSALLQFRRSMACLNTPTPFGGAFGLADKRENCIQSAQNVYRRLLLNNPEQSELSFETLALLGLKEDGTLDQEKLKELIRLFRPDRDGTLDILHFVKSIDQVYKDIRLLRASVVNASKIDKSFETIVNWIFYVVAFTIILNALGYSPMALFLSISGVILAFAFMIGSASSKYFEGLLFILVRRPYAIGDGIHVMGVETEGIFTGHPFWYVEDVTLFTTSVLYMYTGERATLSNGSLANSRIVNATRSPQAWMYTMVKFPVDVSHEKLQIYNTALEQFFRNRPREWRSYDSFRSTFFNAQAGYIEYMVCATHRNSWHDWTTVHVSKAEMVHFCMELSKQLGIFYRTPPMPVDLTITNAPQSSSPFGINLPGVNMPIGPEGEFLPPPRQDTTPFSEPPQQPDLDDLYRKFPARLT